MALPVQQQIRYWGIATAIFLLVLWYLGQVIMPFLLGGAIAYFLDPLADRLERLGCSRVVATAIITIIGLLGFIFIALLIIPTFVRQAVALVEAAPTLFGELQAFLTERIPALMDDNSTLRQSLSSLGEAIKGKGGEFLNGLISSALSIVNVLVLLVITPVVAFYLLLDWDRMIARIDSLLPLDYAPVVRDLASQIDATMAAFLRGQSTVCLILGSFYAVSLMVVGLNFGLVAGFIAGALTFIPYVGALVGGALAIGLALFQFWGDWWSIGLVAGIFAVGQVLEGNVITPKLVGGALAIGLALFQFWGDWWSIGLVAGIFAVGQVLEGNVITPKLVGSSVGLHPVWLIFALSAFGTLFGFVGMLVAVPVTAALGVVARYLIAEYKQGRLYLGVSGRDQD